MKSVSIGKLDRRVTFLEDQGQENQFNEKKALWADVFTVWGRMISRPGLARVEADQVTQETAMIFHVRRKTRINDKLRMKCDGGVYRIISITEPAGFRRQLMEIKAELLPEIDA